MPDLASSLRIALGPVVSPIVGNSNIGGGCYDGHGEALYAVNVGGNFEVWRTRAGWQTIILEDGSVDYLSTILAGSIIDYPSSAALQRINGTIYATISGKDQSTLKMGTWIYRDTSSAQDGSGPWVKHGTVQEATYPVDVTTHHMGGQVAGEILVTGGLWATNGANFKYASGAGFTETTQGVYTSADGGVTWTQRLDVGFYFGARYGYRWSRNFAQFGGYWYVGGAGNVDPGKNFKSADLITWTDIGALDAPGGDGMDFPISTPGVIYRIFLTATLQYAVAAPDASPTWVNVGALPYTEYAFPLLANVHSDASQVYAAFNHGQVMRVSVAQTVAPPCRQYPREDGLATSSASRIFPQPRSLQGGNRRAGGTYY